LKTKLELGATTKIHCRTCNIETPHELRGSSFRGKYDTLWEGTEFETLHWWEEYEYRFWVCQICDTAILEINYSNAAMYGSEDQDQESTWCPRPVRMVPAKSRLLKIKREPLNLIYHEIIDSYNAELRMTCAMGIRALFEAICVDQGIKDEEPTRGLQDKIDVLGERGIIEPDVADNLFSLKFLGDDAAHRLDIPTDQELKLGIKVLEKLISFVYRESERELGSTARELALMRKDAVEAAKSQKANRKIKRERRKNRRDTA